jgi:hypothetical protein
MTGRPPRHRTASTPSFPRTSVLSGCLPSVDGRRPRDLGLPVEKTQQPRLPQSPRRASPAWALSRDAYCRTRMSSAATPSTPASATAGSAPCRTSALDQLVLAGRAVSVKNPQTLIISLYAFTIHRSGTLRQGNDRSGFQLAIPYLIPRCETRQGFCGSRALRAAARGRCTAGQQLRSNVSDHERVMVARSLPTNLP